MQADVAEQYRSEIVFVRDEECLHTIRSIRSILEIDLPNNEILRLMTVPML